MCLSDHSCVFYDDIADAWPICADPVAAAARAGFRWLVVSDEVANGQARLGAAGFPASSIASPREFGMEETPVSTVDVIRRIRAQTEATVAAGFSGLLLLIDMSWLLRAPSGIAHHGEFEAALQELMAAPLPLRAVCLYHLAKFPEGMMLDAMRTHPRVRTTDGEFDNPHFLPPRAFLSGDSAAKLQTWMTTLRPLTDNAKTRSRRGRRPPTAGGAATGAGLTAPAAIEDSDAPTKSVACEQRWKIRCFGTLRIYRRDGTPVRWNVANGATIKTKTLFAYLLHCGANGVGAEELADLLWPQAESLSQSLNRLYHTIHCLRMALSPDLKHSRVSPHVLGHDHHYLLALPEGTWVDVPMFEQFCRRGEKLLKTGQLDDALACYASAEMLHTGTLLSDIPAEYSENTDKDWCWSRRYWLEEIYVKMLTQMSSIYRSFENLDRAAAYAEKALKIEPCFEPAHQELMHIFHRMGRRDAIERQYRVCLGALRRQEDRAPSADTRILFQRLVS